ncbi:MAG: ATP-binding protein [Alphaproteobacteria bacterium]
MRLSSNLWLSTTAAVALPTGIVLLLLSVLGALEFSTALGAFAISAAILAVLLHPHVAQIVSVRGVIEGLMGHAPPHPLLGGPDPYDLAKATRRLVHEWGRKDQTILRLVRESESILDSLPDAILLIDRDLVVQRANKAAQKLLGTHLARREFAAILRHPELLDAVVAVSKGAGVQEVEFVLAGRAMSNLLAHIEAVPRPEGDENWLLLSLHDQTQIKQTERMRADFVANASHELRTPLSVLLGFIETLNAGADDDLAVRKRFLGIMGEQAARMSRLVNDLLSLSRIEMHEHRAPTDPVALDTIIRSVADTLQFRAKDRDIALALAIEPQIGTVPGDAEELTQVVQNLVDNAIKYGRPGSTVAIAARTELRPDLEGGTHWVAIEVRDQGDGISREHLSRLTERFYRVDAARSREMGGTGLGLAIVKHVVNRHRGAIEIASTIGIGSSFTVRFPANPSRNSEAKGE